MDQKKIILKDITKTDPFKVPEGYFEHFTNNILSQLPDGIREEPKTISLWQRVRPWAYMAAMFLGMGLIIDLFVNLPSQPSVKKYASEGLKLSSSSDIDDFYHYYEDELAKVAYDDAVYLADHLE